MNVLRALLRRIIGGWHGRPRPRRMYDGGVMYSRGKRDGGPLDPASLVREPRRRGPGGCSAAVAVAVAEPDSAPPLVVVVGRRNVSDRVTKS
jgi:hypothetical protein